jgi:hypothetical protein
MKQDIGPGNCRQRVQGRRHCAIRALNDPFRLARAGYGACAGRAGIESGSEGMPILRHALRPHPGLMAALFVTLVVSIEQERQHGNAFFAYRLQFAGIDSKRLENRRRDL